MDDPSNRLSPSAARRLPRHVFIAALLIGIAMFAGSVLYANLVLSPAHHATLADYANPQLLLPTLESMLSSALLAALLAWSVMRAHLERRGAASVRPGVVLGAFVLIDTVLLAADNLVGPMWVNRFASGLFEHMRLALFGMPSEVTFAISFAFLIALFTLIDAILVLLAAWLALLIGARRSPDAAAPAPAFEAPGARAVAVLCGLFVLVVAMKSQFISSQVLQPYREQHPWALSGDLLGPLIAFGLAYWGTRRGVGRPAQMRPLRAIAVVLASLGVKFSASLAIGFLWTIALALVFDVRLGPGSVLGLIALLAIAWLVLSVLLPYWFSGVFYARVQQPESQP